MVSAALIKQTVTYVDLVAATLVIYDYVLTFRDEVELVWSTKWNIGKVLFVATRYPAFADTAMVLLHQFAVLSARQCGFIYRAIGWMLGAGIGVAEIILTMRTIVIWRRSRVIMILLPLLLVCFWVPLLWFLNEALSSLVFAPPPREGLPGCFLASQKNILFVCFILIMGFETVILALTLIKAVGHFRQANSTLVLVLFRDGIMNYIYLFILSVINVIVLLTAHHGYSTLLTALQRVMHSILSARILLHLRGVNRKGNTDFAMLKPADLFPTIHRRYSTFRRPRGTTQTEADSINPSTQQAGPATYTRNGEDTDESETMLEQWFGDNRDRYRDEINSTYDIEMR